MLFNLNNALQILTIWKLYYEKSSFEKNVYTTQKLYLKFA